ncbi:dethiobiotin synthase [Rudanella paleaurantiibacter]|uniref:ATP-dependent dethiobiotin synthetase BioD n=1 Tax=Rudanella paleaurantiibacter TaxID=2614655 RepID=A0A7J5TXH6_9BACT|nr:dethiobiotin synthase [Rudanella paleaurantiibacter]KAB7729320.1 dethiobiotin synthase [Rudanella paleaurantiibacter]
MNIVVAGIGTEIGKTVVSAVLVEALQADYWKPVQSGALEDSDTETVRSLISNTRSRFHPEAYRLREPLSPHAAADIDGVRIELDQIVVPQTDNHLVIELAGGLMVPLNHQQLNIDWVQQQQLPVVLVSRNYLGSINHTLLSVEALRTRNIPILGLIFSGPTVPASESVILGITGLSCLGRVAQEPELTQAQIRHYAEKFLPSLNSMRA